MTRRTVLVRSILAPVVFGMLVLALWQIVTTVGRVPPFLLPSPSAIAGQFRANFAGIVDAATATGINASVGLVAGVVSALLIAVLALRVRLIDELITPLAAAAAAVPIVALAPLLNSMFSATTDLPRRVVVAIVVFFPVFVSTAKGLRQATAVHLDLMTSYAASAWQITRTVRVPAAVPYVVTGLRVAAPGAVIAAVIAEYFGGLQNGLGSRITSAASNTAYPRAWSYVLGAMIVGLLFFVVVLIAERLVIRPRQLHLSADS